MQNDPSGQTRYRFRLRPEIRRALAFKNISQNEVARHCGISSGYMSQLLSGGRFPGPCVRRKLLQALSNLKFEELFEEVAS
jgi:transcriptional regulator with XRE-family HTH domain